MSAFAKFSVPKVPEVILYTNKGPSGFCRAFPIGHVARVTRLHHRCSCFCGVLCDASAGCPFARRAWLTMIEKGIPHTLVTIPLMGQLKAYQSGRNLDTMAQWYPGKSIEEVVQIKEDYKRDVNPTGQVPTVVVDGNIVTEADVASEYLDDRFPDAGTRLMPQDALARARTRHFLKVLFDDNGVDAYYGLLKNQDPAKDEAYRARVYKGLAAFCGMADATGPFFLGARFSFADAMLAPMWDQFRYLLPHYRGVEFCPTGADAASCAWAPRFARWAAAVEARPSFAQLARGKEAYVASYAGYAGARGASEFGK